MGIGSSIGAGLSGFNRALAQDQQYRGNEQRLSLGDMEMKQRQRLFEQQDADFKAEQEANQAGINALNERKMKYEADAAAGAQIQAGTQAPGAAPAPWQPKPQDMLAAEQAAYDKLYQQGRYQAFNKRYAQAETMRGQLRAKTGQQVLSALGSGGDVTNALREHDALMDDGTELLEAMPLKGKDGSAAYRLRRKNRLTGEAMPETDVTAEQLGMMVTTSMADPKTVATQTYAMYKQNARDEAAAKKAEEKANRDDERQAARDESMDRRAAARDEANGRRAERVANIQAGASRYRADIGLEGAQYRTDGQIARGGATDSAAERQALTQERIAADNTINQAMKQLETARSVERPALQAELAAAKEEKKKIQAKLDSFGASKRGGLSGASSAAAPAGAQPGAQLPDINSFFRR